MTPQYETTFVLADPTSTDGESAFDLLDDDDRQVSIVVLVSGPMSAALHDFAYGEGVDATTAGWVYLDQLASRFSSDDRLVETVLATGPDAALELEQLAAMRSTRRVLLPTSLLRLDLGAYRRLADRDDIVAMAPALEPAI